MSKTLATMAIFLCMAALPAAAEPAPAPASQQESSNPPTAQAEEEEPVELVVHLDIPEQEVENPPAKSSQEAKSRNELREQARAARRTRLTREALSYRGAPYVWGGESVRGFDCSGFTQYLYSRRGVKLPRTSSQQFAHGTPVEREDLLPGDLVFFKTARGIATHVGMYIGDGKFANAANKRRGVTTDLLSSPYYARRYVGARRYTKDR